MEPPVTYSVELDGTSPENMLSFLFKSCVKTGVSRYPAKLKELIESEFRYGPIELYK